MCAVSRSKSERACRRIPYKCCSCKKRCFIHLKNAQTNRIVISDTLADLGGKPLLFGAWSHYLFSARTSTVLFAAYSKRRENTFKSPLRKRLLAGDVCSKKKNTVPWFTSRLAFIRVFTYHHAASPGCSQI